MINIALVVPCKDFIKDAVSIFKEHDELDSDQNKYLFEFKEIVVGEENQHNKIHADIIITRGLLAEILRRISGDIPIVEIAVSSSDILRTIRKCSEQFGRRKIGVIAASNMLTGLNNIYDLLDTPIETYRLGTNWNGSSLVKKAQANGCEIILGGINTCKYAEDLQIDNMVIESSPEALWQAITQAKKMIITALREQEKAKRLQAILDDSSDGVIVINESNEIVMLNPKAASLMDLDKTLNEQKIDNTSILPEFKILMQDNNEYTNEVFQYNKILLNINKRFIKVKDVVSDIVFTIQGVQDLQRLEGSIRKRIYSKGHTASFTFSKIIGETERMKQIIKVAKRYSRTNSNILLIGESGTGKEVFAQSIHRESDRFSNSFVAINCAAIPEQLLESELFGYVSGSFTGANKNGKAGLFEIAHRGTIFLDEIAEIPLTLQAKLLRVLQEREFMRVGSDEVIKVDIRLVAATNKDLRTLVKENQFREDLFYRLDVLRIELPTLEEHKGDIPFLVEDYYHKNYPEIKITEEAKQLLMHYSWPGNVRHLYNICERLAVLYTPNITQSDVKAVLHNTSPGRLDDHPTNEKERILQTLIKTQYNRSKTAKSLGMSRSTLWRKMKEYQITVDRGLS
ncbi:sigma 54-interacting transcriptional regulator [Guptibacillus hwajinpoensis]|uniref:sigma 54-interacting transcriptional regulator n=1 Tax=Guptibacillus hwajinpoensis TaxID=208199 RepID=UPI0024B3255B|nr:sigma 54-interacting transcriptional regulator [Pseudalkalibacillus hwajinpoensis]